MWLCAWYAVSGTAAAYVPMRAVGTGCVVPPTYPLTYPPMPQLPYRAARTLRTVRALKHLDIGMNNIGPGT
eukprot:3940887-Rhodomonas_salina.2